MEVNIFWKFRENLLIGWCGIHVFIISCLLFLIILFKICIIIRRLQLRSGRLRKRLVFLKSGVCDDRVESYGSCDNFEKHLISSFVDYPSSSGINVDCHLRGPLCVNEFWNVYFDGVIIDRDECDHVLCLKRYFLSLVVFWLRVKNGFVHKV